MYRTVQSMGINQKGKRKRKNKLPIRRKAVMKSDGEESHPYFFTNICGYSGISYWDTTTNSWS